VSVVPTGNARAAKTTVACAGAGGANVCSMPVAAMPVARAMRENRQRHTKSRNIVSRWAALCFWLWLPPRRLGCRAELSLVELPRPTFWLPLRLAILEVPLDCCFDIAVLWHGPTAQPQLQSQQLKKGENLPACGHRPIQVITGI